MIAARRVHKPRGWPTLIKSLCTSHPPGVVIARRWLEGETAFAECERAARGGGLLEEIDRTELSAGTVPEVDQIAIYTDGACSGNGRGNARGGWAAILVHPSKVRELSGAEANATNQRMELRAAIEALKALTTPFQVILYSDSAYVVNCFRDRWYEAWRQNEWRNKKKQPVVNRELWEELLELVETRGHIVEFKKVVGHADKLGRTLDNHESFNQRCDELAVAAIAAR